jgi:hypothetical protein
MGSYENIVKLEEIRRKVDEGDLLSAQKILDTMDIRKVKNIADLNLMAEVYSENERYDEARELYQKIYERSKTRKALYQLVDISIKNSNPEDAQEYLKEYLKAAPKDFCQYIFRYRIDKLKGESYEQLIDSLETLKKTEYMEQWAYELAKLYYKAGMEKECIRECSDIVLWFGEGIYVEKAKMLRSYFSGETDKDKIINELKRRSEMKSDSSNTAEDDTSSASEQFEADHEEDKEEDTDNKVEYAEMDEAEYNAVNEQVDAEENETEYDIVNGQGHTTDNETEYAGAKEAELTAEHETVYGVYAQEEYTANDDELLDNEVELNQLYSDTEEGLYQAENLLDTEDILDFENGLKKEIQNILSSAQPEDGEEQAFHTSNKTEEDRADQEVEATIYKLLEEEDVEEEDKKLDSIAKAFQIDMDEIFGNFLQGNSVKRQLVKSLESILQEDAKSVFMIITGSGSSEKTTLAKKFALFLNQSGRLNSSRVAKITADKLNTVDILAKKENLMDSCLVVEDAGNLKRVTIESLLELSRSLQGDIAIILEEEKKNLNKLFREYPKLMDLLKIRIHLPR